jgi:hypothetical protein
VLNRWYATKIAREWNVPAGGVGYVTQFDVETAFLSHYPVHQAGGRDVLEYWIPAEELEEFNSHIVGRILDVAEYRGPVTGDVFGPLPDAWRDYLQGESWWCRGWLGEIYVHLYRPEETFELAAAWGDATALHPGIAIIGGGGSREQLAIDLRRTDSPVFLVDITSDGWHSAIEQTDTIAEFVAAIEAGTFTFRW